MHGPLSQRLKEIRARLALSSALMAERVGLSDRKSWENYERGVSSPKADVLSRLVDLGIDARWLLTGQGQMTPMPQSLDRSRLHAILLNFIDTVRRDPAALNDTPVDDLAAWIVAGYDWLGSVPAADRRQTAADRTRTDGDGIDAPPPRIREP